MNKKIRILVLIIMFMFILTSISYGEEPDVSLFGRDITITDNEDPESFVFSLQLLFLLTVLTLAPSILIMMTSFTRVLIVLSFIRNAIGTQQTPPNQIVVGLAIFLTFFIMAPVGTQMNNEAIKPYLAEEISQEEALEKGMEPVRNFMFEQTRDKDLGLFLNMKGLDSVETLDEIPTHVLVPAFTISELKTAFQMGFIIFIPFLVIDMIVSSTLMAMGMMMLPPVIISMPFKILLFVLVDGWNVIIKSLVLSF